MESLDAPRELWDWHISVASPSTRRVAWWVNHCWWPSQYFFCEVTWNWSIKIVLTCWFGWLSLTSDTGQVSGSGYQPSVSHLGMSCGSVHQPSLVYIWPLCCLQSQQLGAGGTAGGILDPSYSQPLTPKMLTPTLQAPCHISGSPMGLAMVLSLKTFPDFHGPFWPVFSNLCGDVLFRGKSMPCWVKDGHSFCINRTSLLTLSIGLLPIFPTGGSLGKVRG